VLSIHVAKLAQSAQESVEGWVPGLGSDQVGGDSKTEDSYPIDLARGLGGGGAGCREDFEGETPDEGTPVHQ
jgi:hypothetical protein